MAILCVRASSEDARRAGAAVSVPGPALGGQGWRVRTAKRAVHPGRRHGAVGGKVSKLAKKQPRTPSLCPQALHFEMFSLVLHIQG